MSTDLRQLTPSEFPSLLKEIPDAPSTLYIRGEMPQEETRLLCVVGSRKATAYGKEVCTSLIKGLSGYNIAIVSGLALGIDAISHRAALDCGLKAVAVPGSGLGDDVLYPRSNYRLAKEIIRSGGALISEFEENFKARPESFPQRNRIMAGMSHAVLVIEAEIRSGTLITSRLATEYNRDVLTIPGSIFSSSSSGPNMLIKLGAVPITSSMDILEALDIKADEDKVEIDTKTLSENERKVFDILSEPRDRNELIESLKLPTHEANSLISAMELKGLIIENMGKVRLSRNT